MSRNTISFTEDQRGAVVYAIRSQIERLEDVILQHNNVPTINYLLGDEVVRLKEALGKFGMSLEDFDA